MLGLDSTFYQKSHNGIHARKGSRGNFTKHLLSVNKEETSSTRPEKCSERVALLPDGMGSTRHHSICIFGSFSMQTYCSSQCSGRQLVSTDVPDEMGGTGCSAERKRSSLVCPGTEMTPERCFGNSGENWSARRRQGKTIINERNQQLKKLVATGWRTEQSASEAPGPEIR